jgi:hypothetical protein
MPARINGFSLAYTAVGGVVLWSGIKGEKISDTFRGLLAGKPPTPGEQPITGAATSGGAAGGTGAGSVAAGVAVAEGGTSETEFQTMMLQDLGAPVTQANLASLHAWFLHEEPSFPPPNLWNPLNIENGVGGFEQYSSAAEGARASAGFIVANGYGCIRMNLLSGRGLCGGQCGPDFLRWSGNGYSAVC